jgi:hypothetical protein
VLAACAATFSLTASTATAFPGFIVQKGEVPSGVVHTTHVVLLLHAGFVVTTVMVDYEGPLTPFALVLPVPPDVGPDDIETVKREIVSRLEQVSAPRFHTFYEKNPCEVDATEQQWDERLPATGRGFLTPRMLPPADDEYKVSNELSVPDSPVFKGAESEFRYRIVAPRTVEEAKDWFDAHGYRAREAALTALGPYLSAGKRLLVAAVLLDHVELVGPNHVQLGGIRHVSRVPAWRDGDGESVTLPSRLARSDSAGVQDLFVYVLHRERRFEVLNYDNAFPPTNVVFDPEAESDVGPLYNALFDHKLTAEPHAFVTEFAWTTDGCGEPCPNAPLRLHELMSLGGDVLERKTVSPAERAAKAAKLTEKEYRKLAAELVRLPPRERARARREFEQGRNELERRRALFARQTYVLSRLHHRYRASLPRDVEIGPAKAHVAGGTGVPRGLHATLSRAVRPAAKSRMQVRFVATRPWVRPMPCVKKERFRWGKRWDSERQTLRKVWLALDLPRTRRDARLLERALGEPLPELGLEPTPAPAPSSPRTARASSDASSDAGKGTCSAAGPGSSRGAAAHFAGGVLVLLSAWARRRTPKAAVTREVSSATRSVLGLACRDARRSRPARSRV